MKRPFRFAPLSGKQKALLCQLAGQAYLIERRRGSIEDTLDKETYRRQGQAEACGLESLTDCDQSHFLALRAKWFVITDRLEEAFNDLLNAGEIPQALAQMRWRFVGQISVLAEGIAQASQKKGLDLAKPEAIRQAIAYAESVARQKHRVPVKSLGVEDLEELGYTMVNRGNAKLGKGDSFRRNKSQRLKRRADDRPEGGSFIEQARQRLGIPQAGRCG